MNALIFLSIIILVCLIADKWVNRYKDIYFVDEKTHPYERRFYKMVKPVGSLNGRGCEHCALWKPVNSFLWIFWIRRTNNFWLDMEGFQPFKNQSKKRLTSMKCYLNY